MIIWVKYKTSNIFLVHIDFVIKRLFLPEAKGISTVGINKERLTKKNIGFFVIFQNIVLDIYTTKLLCCIIVF